MTAGRASSSVARSPVAGLSFGAGHPLLNFINTREERRSDTPREFLMAGSDVALAAARLGLLSPAEADALKRDAAAHPRRSWRRLEVLRGFRETLYRLVVAARRGAPADPGDLGRLNAALAEGQARRQLVFDGARYVLRDVAGADPWDRIRWALARHAADLLASDRLARVKACQGDGCGWLFIDGSRTRKRVWCSMDVCGNRAKARRFYQRHRGRRSRSRIREGGAR